MPKSRACFPQPNSLVSRTESPLSLNLHRRKVPVTKRRDSKVVLLLFIQCYRAGVTFLSLALSFTARLQGDTLLKDCVYCVYCLYRVYRVYCLYSVLWGYCVYCVYAEYVLSSWYLFAVVQDVLRVASFQCSRIVWSIVIQVLNFLWLVRIHHVMWNVASEGSSRWLIL